MRRHRFDPLSFLLGAALLVVGLPFLLSGDFPLIRPSRIWPLALIGVGLVLGAWALASLLGRGRSPVPVETASDLADGSGPPPASPSDEI